MIPVPELTIQPSSVVVNSVEASWTTPEGAESYVLQRSRSPEFLPAETVTVFSGAQSTYTDTLQYSSIYYYRVKAASDTDESDWSGEVEIAVRVQVVADFTVSQRSGTPPLEISFKDRSSGDVTEWLWNFGDGEFSTLRDPVHVYGSVGVYKITLTASNNEGSDTEVKPDYISVVDIYAHDTAPEPDRRVFLAGRSTVAKEISGVRVIQEAGTSGGFTRKSGPSLIFD